jgi:tRNA (cmo5U34)-methyltransferase
MESTAAGYFGAMVAEYDSLIRRAVPRYDEMTTRLVDYLPRSATSVLELGCGTGNLTVALAARYPDTKLTVVDAAPEMLAATKARLGERTATFVEKRFEDLSFADGEFDLVVSSISLHHLRDKGPVYRNVHSALAAGGAFCFSDQLAGATARLHDHNWIRWLEFCRAPGNCSDGEVQSLLDHAAAHDHYTPLPEQFALLERAGFSSVDCVWRNWIWGIIIGER